MQLWDVATASEIKKIQLGPLDGSINDVAFDPTGRYLITGNGNIQSLYILRLAPADKGLGAGGEGLAKAGATGSASALPLAKLDFPDIKTPRELAEWTLRIGGMVNAGNIRNLPGAAAKEIAAKDFQLAAVRYDGLKAIDDDAIDTWSAGPCRRSSD